MITATRQIVFSESRNSRCVSGQGRTPLGMVRLRDNPEVLIQSTSERMMIPPECKTSRSISTKMGSTVYCIKARSEALYREQQGVNLHTAGAPHRAGFDAIDVHMSDLLHRTHASEDLPPRRVRWFLHGDVPGAGWLGEVNWFNDRMSLQPLPLSANAGAGGM